MSRLTAISVPLDLVLRFTRTSPTLTRQARIDAFQGLIDRCNGIMGHCINAQVAACETYNMGETHLERLNALHANLPPDVHGKLASMAEQLKTHSAEELEAVKQDLKGLLDVRLDAEMARECPSFRVM